MTQGDEVRIVHALPGRVRLKVAAIKGKPGHAERLREVFAQVPGVQAIEYNTLTGSVLIRYDSRRLRAEDAAGRLRIVLQEHLPGLDVDAILNWLRGPV
ncbi:MAG: HMA2 domain-containing protein [Thiobacillaceae bacterium]